ncbi:MAG: hypothetical protein RMJ85_14635 [Anaerolineales bacterium]|nr:hypothetical protein [Anaerolineales bacterium]
MSNKIKTLLLALFAVAMLMSCSHSLPGDEPDLGIDIDTSQINTAIKVTAPKSVNSYKLGTPLELEIVNLSAQVLEFRIDDVQIFRIEDNRWKKVSYTTKTIVVDDFIIDLSEVNNIKSLTLEPNGVFPGYKRFIDVLPDVKSDKSVFLRIFVFAHTKELENMPQNIVGAFVDVSLRP